MKCKTCGRTHPPKVGRHIDGVCWWCRQGIRLAASAKPKKEKQ